MKLNSPFNFFDAIYCLTTESRTEKFESALKEFDSIGIANRIIRFNGNVIDEKYTRSRDIELNIPRWALTSLSHLEIWRIAKENDLVNVLIFEDDVTFVDWKNEALSEAIAHIATIDWELFYLGYNIFGDAVKYAEIGNHLIELQAPVDIRSTHAYCLSRAAYEKVIGYNPFQSKAVDMWLPTQLKMHCLVPLMTVQDQLFMGYQKRDMFLSNFRKIGRQ